MTHVAAAAAAADVCKITRPPVLGIYGLCWNLNSGNITCLCRLSANMHRRNNLALCRHVDFVNFEGRNAK